MVNVYSQLLWGVGAIVSIPRPPVRPSLFWLAAMQHFHDYSSCPIHDYHHLRLLAYEYLCERRIN